MDVRNKVVDGVMSPVGMLCIFAVLVSVASLGHSYWVCTRLASERQSHKEYMESTSKTQNDLIVAAINTSTLAIQAQNNFTTEMRKELTAREAALIGAVERVEKIALALEWRAREFQKAALSHYRLLEKQTAN
jgi:hypothetical protein